MASAQIKSLQSSKNILMASQSAVKPIKGIYYPSWFTLEPSLIRTEFFTHIYYAFLTPNAATFTFEIDQAQAARLRKFTSTLHAKAPPLKILFSVGGAAEGTALFTRLASIEASRSAFIHSSIKVARDYGFDGIDLDWEFPETPTDMEKFGRLLKEWRAEVQREAADTARPPLLLVAAVYYSADITYDEKRAYPGASIAKNLDWINVMNYDYHGSWDTTKTGAPAALFDPNSNYSTSYGLGSWIGAGVPPKQLIMGLPLYGRTWKLRDPKIHGIGAPAVGVGPGWNGSGTLTYAEVVEFNGNNNAVPVFDKTTVSAYSVAGDSWVGYDDEKTVREKIGYARGLGLRGYFFWAINGDYNWTVSQTASKSWPL